MINKVPTWVLCLALFGFALIALLGAANAETMVIERIVPEGATLTYSENGVAVRTSPVPPGRVRVTIEYGGPVTPRHRRRD